MTMQSKPRACNEVLHEMVAIILFNAASSRPEITGMVSSGFVEQLEKLVYQTTGKTFDPPMHKAKVFLPIVPEGSSMRAALKVVECKVPRLVMWEVTKKQPRIKI